MMVKKAKKPEEIIQFASMWNMDGIVIIGFCAQDYTYLRSHMRIPFVIYDGFCEKPDRFCNITIDNYDGGRQVGTLFRQQNHKAVLCISDNDTDMDHQRYRGFCDGFGSDNIDFLIIPMHKQDRWAFYQDHLPVLRSVSAIFAVSDYYAIDLTGTWLFGVPLGLVTAFVFGFPIPLVYAFLSTEECIRLAMAFCVFRRKKWMVQLEQSET